jgi:hypothetical protein
VQVALGLGDLFAFQQGLEFIAHVLDVVEVE